MDRGEREWDLRREGIDGVRYDTFPSLTIHLLGSTLHTLSIFTTTAEERWLDLVV